ncbi:hypothetical protein UFOVP772_56 [uncultured Caudovirales phage]|uniref:Uncharacterized protein n=1 Tax=uncultured Caudovirales phage TaxID=2100421 RepID=A0A6J5P1Y8_9CAUD|nr:hypothetical protein UFOVP772_56 [uncultured Caudovirales phage]
MAINFPTSLDNFTNPVSGNTLDSPSHSLQHSDINDAVEAMQRKVGVGTAVAGSASAGQVLTISAAGTSTWSTPTTPGFVQVVPASVAVGSGSGSVDANGTISFSGVTSISVNNCFSSAYKNYQIIFNASPNTGANAMRLRMRAGGTDNSSLNYAFGASYNNSSGAGGVITSSTANTIAYIGDIYDRGAIISILISNPFVTDYTTYWFNAMTNYSVNTGLTSAFGGGGLSVTTSYDGFSLFPNTNNMTGNISIFGYR